MIEIIRNEKLEDGKKVSDFLKITHKDEEGALGDYMTIPFDEAPTLIEALQKKIENK